MSQINILNHKMPIMHEYYKLICKINANANPFTFWQEALIKMVII